MHPYTRALCVTLVALAPVAAARAAGGPCNLIITSTPSEAKVVMDGKEIGTTPHSVPNLPRGEHTIKVSLDGYETYRRDIKLRPGINSVRAELLREGESREPTTTRRPPGLVTRPTDTGKQDEDEDEIPRTIQVKCPACDGSGSVKEIGCHKCATTGYVQQDGEMVSCSTCGGTGRLKNACRFCRGQGEVKHRQEGTIKCPRCKGSGLPPCPFCKGEGTIPLPNPERARYTTKPCPDCKGTGCTLEVKCWNCGGKGNTTHYPPRRNANARRPDAILLDCKVCGGDGKRPAKCPVCRGNGYTRTGPPPVPCPRCRGSGENYPPCRSCRGRGYVRSLER